MAPCSPYPFWSETRQAFVDAADLQEGERLHCADHSLVNVVSVKPIFGAESVFNLETHTHHVYTVGEVGMLVHNTCGETPNVSSSRAPSLRSTKDRLDFRGEPNSVIRGTDVARKGGGKRAFVTDGEGKIIREITPQRSKVRKVTGTNPEGQTFEKFEKIIPTPPEDLKILSFFDE